MKSDLDQLMQDHHVDAILVTGSGQHNPAMVYLTGGGPFSADYIKRRGQPAVLFHWPMEHDEAARSGLALRSYYDYPFRQFLAEAQGDHSTASALQYRQMLLDLGISSGRIALYGISDLGRTFGIFSKLMQLMPDLTFFSEQDLLGIA